MLKGLKIVDDNHIIRAFCTGMGVYACENVDHAQMRGSERSEPGRCATLRNYNKLQRHNYQPCHKIGVSEAEDLRRLKASRLFLRPSLTTLGFVFVSFFFCRRGVLLHVKSRWFRPHL